MLRIPSLYSRFLRRKSLKISISDRLEDYTVVDDPSDRLVDMFMREHGNSRTDFKREDLATWKKAWGDDYKFGLFFPKDTEDIAFSFNTVQYKSVRFQPDFQHLGMAWIPEKYRGKEILKVITQYLKETEHMKTKNMLACNVHWSQNFWKQATGNSDMSSCIYYISYYDVNDLKLASDCDIGSHGVVVKNIDSKTITDVINYDQKVFPFSRAQWTIALFTEGIARIAYDRNGNPVGIGCVSIYPSGECVISPLYANDQKIAQLIFQSILEELLSLQRGKQALWRIQVRSNDQCRNSYQWILPFLKCPLRRSHLSNLCYSIYRPKHFFDFSKVFVNCHPTNGPC